MGQAAATWASLRELPPGVLLSAAVGAAAVLLAPLVAPLLPLPAMVLALVIGVALGGLARQPVFAPGIAFCVKTLLRWAVGLLGLRIALGDILAFGAATVAIVLMSMLLTLVSGVLLARLLAQNPCYGILAGAGTAVCGASATLATSTVLPSYPGKQADIVFVVIAVNALSTLAMIVYPPLCALLGLDARATGVMLGATIQDVAQVVGAGYAVSEAAGNSAVIVKLFRVFLLLPLVLGIGYWFSRRASAAQVPAPVFAFVFLALCLLNSVMPSLPALAPVYAPLRAALIEMSTWGLLIAIGALGLGTSLSAIAGLGWRHIVTVSGTTLVILLAVAGSLLALG